MIEQDPGFIAARIIAGKISTKDVYNIYRRFKFRKTERTPYLDHTRDLLIKRLEREANE